MKKLFLALGAFLLFGCELEEMDTPGNLVPKTVAEDQDLPSAEINGTKLHLETFGDINNELLILLHGGPGGDYRALISEKGKPSVSRYPGLRTDSALGLSRLSDDYFIICYDQRSAGLSQREESSSFTQYVDDLNLIIDHFLDLKLQTTGRQDTAVNIFAWSFGGILATGLINEHPQKVKNIVFYEPGPFDKETWDYLKENTTSIFSQIGKEWLEEYLQSKDYLSADSHERADYSLMLNVFRAQPEFHEDPNTPLWRFGALLADDNLDFSASKSYDISSSIIRDFKGQALFIAGAKTVAELPEYMERQRKHYPNSSYLEIPNLGHTGPWEKPLEINQAIRNFID